MRDVTQGHSCYAFVYSHFHPIMPSAKPSASHRRHNNLNSEDEDDPGEEGAEWETTPDQSSLFSVDVDGISNRKRVQRWQGPDDISNPSHTTPPHQAWR